jgi:hypothetical protein
MTGRLDSFAEFQRRQRAKQEPGTNSPDLPSLSHEEVTCVEAARDALATIKRTFEFWMVIARGLRTLKDKAERIGGRFTFDRLREREGLGGRNKQGKEVLNKTRVSRLLFILAHLAEVEAWRKNLTDKQRFDWASPEAIIRRCPVFAKAKDPNAPRKPTPLQAERATNIMLQEQLHEANARLQADGSQFDLQNTGAEVIGRIIVNEWRQQPSRIETLIRTLNAELRELKARIKAARPKPPGRRPRPASS